MNFINIFEMIVLSSLIGNIIVLMILITKRIFRDKLNPSFHYYIWLILLIKLIIPFGPQTSLNIFNVYEKFNVQSAANKNTPQTQIKISQQLKDTKLDNLISTDSFQPSNRTEINNAIVTPVMKKFNIRKVLFAIWMLVTILLIVVLAIANKKLRKIIKESIRNIDSRQEKILYNCMCAMGIKSKVEILYSTQISSPCLCGFINPKILIPENIAKSVCNKEFKYIIMHELCHLKNKDIFINRIINLLSLIYWFNPILLYSFHKMRQDCEIACDGQVISYLDKDENIQYGSTIIRVLELGGSSKRIIASTSMVMNSSEIKRRIIMISKYKKMSPKNVLLGVIISISIGVLGISMNTSKAIEDNNILETKTIAINKNIVSNKANETVIPDIEVLASDSTKSIVPFSSDIVIYNSHPEEAYPSGIKVTDVSTSINDKLIKEGINSRFIKSSQPTEYIKSYQATRDLIAKNVKANSNTVLLDIHRDATESPDSATRKIKFVLAKSNPHYEKNKRFVDLMISNMKNSSGVKSDIYFFDGETLSYFNQDLSKNSVLIEIGNSMSSDRDIEECINLLVSALKNIQKVSS